MLSPDPAIAGRHGARKARRIDRAWDPSKPAMLGVIRRRAPISSLTWHRIGLFVFHTLNACEDGGSIHCDVIKYGRAPLFVIRGKSHAARVGNRHAHAVVHRPHGPDREVKETSLRSAGRFPQAGRARAGINYSLAFLISHGRPSSRRALQCCRANRPGVRPDGPLRAMANCFANRVCAALRRVAGRRRLLLTVQYIREEDRSDLVVLDASVGKRPVARVHLSHRVPARFIAAGPCSESYRPTSSAGEDAETR